ncbi:MAG TPA: ThiF family adenylyltransferase [Candidatus Sulfotelmatobacter sp.]|jgi:adenylyltransferase/sulfurtransferase|nr:ThiF family adenylyltransferase [Candidatus Sulfotelmatobacter sp.]
MTRVLEGEVFEDRFSRLRLISWWDQEKIAKCRLLVIGAGALGNEILKNAALLGFAQVVVVDLDRIEASNLSRAVLYRAEDVGKFKAEAATSAYRSFAPDLCAQPVVANVIHGCGLGLFEWSDVIVAGLDNREARLWINRSAWKVNRPWIDGAIEGINGVARVFLPGMAPCYECTLGEVDWAMLHKRMSCNLLVLEPSVEGKIPTTPTISSIIAGVQVQEAVKLIHGLPTLASKGLVFEGMNHSSYVVEYTENPDCMSHYTLPKIIHLDQASAELTLEELRQRAQSDLGSSDVVIEFSRDVVQKFVCPACASEEELYQPVGSVPFEQAKCKTDGQLRTVISVHAYSGEQDLGSRALSRLGLPLLDVFTARSGDREIGYIPYGDAPLVLGELACVSAVTNADVITNLNP